MADDQTHIGEPDRSVCRAIKIKLRSKLSIRKFGLTADEVRQTIKRVGNDRQKLEEAARTLKRT